MSTERHIVILHADGTTDSTPLDRVFADDELNLDMMLVELDLPRLGTFHPPLKRDMGWMDAVSDKARALLEVGADRTFPLGEGIAWADALIAHVGNNPYATADAEAMLAGLHGMRSFLLEHQRDGSQWRIENEPWEMPDLHTSPSDPRDVPKAGDRSHEGVAAFATFLVSLALSAFLFGPQLYIIYLYGLARAWHDKLHLVTINDGNWTISNGDVVQPGDGVFALFWILTIVLTLALYSIVWRFLPPHPDAPAEDDASASA